MPLPAPGWDTAGMATKILIQPTHPKATQADTNGWACPHITPDESSPDEITLCPACHDLMLPRGDDDPVLVDSAGRVRVQWCAADKNGKWIPAKQPRAAKTCKACGAPLDGGYPYVCANGHSTLTAEHAAQLFNTKVTAETIHVTPNPNADGYADNWVCEHIDCQPGKADGDVWLCEACDELLDEGAQVIKQPHAAGAGA